MDSSEAWKSFVQNACDETFRPLYESTKRLAWTLGGMEDRESLGITVTLRPLFDPEGEELWFQTFKEWKWRYRCPYLRAGRYAVEVSFWKDHATRTVELEPIEVGGDRELTIEVLTRMRGEK